MNNWLITPTALLILLLAIAACYLVIEDFFENVFKKSGKLSEQRPKIYKLFEPFLKLSNIPASSRQSSNYSKDNELDTFIRQSGYYLTVQDVHRTQKTGLAMGLLLGCLLGFFLFHASIGKSKTSETEPAPQVQNGSENIPKLSSSPQNKGSQTTSPSGKQNFNKKDKSKTNLYFLPFLVVVIMGWIGYTLPKEAVKDQAKKRSKAILKELPFAIDLLAAAMDAGHSFSDAIRNLIETQGSSMLNDEFSTYLKDVSMGKTSSEALQGMDQRIAVPEFTNFVHAIVYALTNGSEVTDIMKVQVEEMRRVKFTRATIKIQEIEPLMEFPLFGLAICVIILIVAAVLIQFKQLGSFGGF